MGVLNLNALVLVNGARPERRWAIEYLLPYLEHFGIPYTLWDIHQTPLPEDLETYALIVTGHPNLNPGGHQLAWSRVLAAVQAGTGLVSFDPVGPLQAHPTGPAPANQPSDESIIFVQDHPITARHTSVETIRLGAALHLEVIAGDEILLESGGSPLLTVSRLGHGNLAQWASMDWMDTHYLGPLGGLDDVLWRSLAWAARKPFVLRGLPPLVTMRVDDVAGTGHLWEESPLGWVQAANRYGFKPWLGIFPFNLTEPAIQELRGLLLSGQATAFPHAFGRPLRSTGPDSEANPCPFYAAERFPLRATSYDEFIYYDHEHGRSWSDEQAVQGLEAIDAWYAEHAPLPMSRYAIGHWGEMGSNTIPHIADRWGCEFIATYHGLDAPLEGAHWLAAGPFRKYEHPGSALFDRAARGDRPLYYADFINFAGRQFFLSCTEVRDETGYEWAPDGNAEQSAGRGLRQLRRALDSLALPVLFTHETDYIYKIAPPAWEDQLARITQGLKDYQSRYVTLDEALRTVRAVRTSRLDSAAYDPQSRQIRLDFSGRADSTTWFYLFADTPTLDYELVEVPPFEQGRVLQHVYRN